MVNSIFLLLTEECNMACTYCFESSRTKGKVTIALCDSLVNYIANSTFNEFSIALFGGEPTICENELIYLVNKISDDYHKFLHVKNVKISLITNALIFPENFMNTIILLLEKNNWLKFSVQFSTTFEESTHNKTRIRKDGGNTYNNVVETIRKYENAIKHSNIDIPTNIHPVVPQDSIHLLSTMYKNIIEKSNSSMWFVPLAEEHWDEKNIHVLEEQIDIIMRYGIDNNNLHKFINYSKLGDNKKQPAPCGAGNAMLSIFPNGAIHQCHRMKYSGDKLFDEDSIDLKNQISLSGMNILHNSIDEINQAVEKNKPIFSNRDESMLITDTGIKCKTCPAFNDCYICAALNIDNTGSMTVVDSMQCKVNIAISRVLNHWKNHLSAHSCNCDRHDNDNTQYTYTINQHSVIIPKLVDSLEDTQKTVNTLIDEHNTVIEYLDYLKKELEELKNKN